MKLRGLYAITSQAICTDAATLLAAVAPIVEHCALVQLRDKSSDPARRESLARALLKLCRAHDRRLLINDDVALAAQIGADGVHLGKSDAPVAHARSVLGPGALIGVTCGDSLDRARAAQRAGADYVAFGRLFPSRTKPDAPPAALAVLAEARTQLKVPICGIGGITPDNARLVVDAGADLVAAIDGLFGAPDPAAAARRYAAIFSPMTGTHLAKHSNLRP